MRSSIFFAPVTIHDSSISVVCALHSTGFDGPVGPFSRMLVLLPLVVGVMAGVVVGTGPGPTGTLDVEDGIVDDELLLVVDVVGVAFLWLLLHAARTRIPMTSSTRRSAESYCPREHFWLRPYPVSDVRVRRCGAGQREGRQRRRRICLVPPRSA